MMKSVAQASFKRRTIYEPNLILRLKFMKRLPSESVKIGKKIFELRPSLVHLRML